MILSAALFDMDGTLIQSLGAVDRCWTAWGKRHGLDIPRVMETIHGRPAEDSIRDLLGDVGEDVIQAEVSWLEKEESIDVEGVTALPGTVELLQKMDEIGLPWAIVTSGSIPVASARVKASGITKPAVFVTADDITHGKPHPEPFLLGAKKLGIDPEKCVVFEDAVSGIAAGKAAGAKTVAVLSHMKKEELTGADMYVASLAEIEVCKTSDGFEIIHKRA